MTTADNNTPGGFPFQLDEFYLDLQENGSRVSVLSQEEITRRPFPGLRPFKTSEFQLFNGRVGQAEELIKRLKKNRFLAVIGSSGTGKSSLVRAGLIPQLFGGYLHGAGSKWNIAICRPGKDPVENLAVALASIKTPTKEPQQLADNFNEIEPLLSNSIYGLLDAKELFDKNENTGSKEKSPSNLLVIIDQFEELFRFDRKDLGKENIENQFVNLLLKASLDPGNAVYVIITMRSEFLGDCVKYRGLPEAINEGQYLVPQLTRNELKEVIENPIKLAGKKIAPNLVELLVNEIEESKLKENLDQLPILQHALMRTYNEAMKDGPDTEISYEHYKGIGEMDQALANHAEAKFKELGAAGADEKQLSKKQQLAKIIFQSLTEMGAGQKGGRRPTELKNIYAIAASLNIGEGEVNEVVNHFRDSDTSFIMPPINTVLYPNLIIDISHESLMRNWARLTDWMTEELKYGNLYKQLNERRELHDYDPGEWLRGILLRELMEWKESYANNATWASRYHQLPKKTNDPGVHKNLYQKNIDFLNASFAVSEKQKEDERMELQENLRREQKVQSAKTRARVFSIAAVISLLFGVWAYAERNNAKHQEIIATEQTAIAVQNAKKADSLKLSAQNSAEEARRNADSATAQRAIAVYQGRVADSIKDIAVDQGKRLAVYAKLAERGKQKATEQKKDFETQLVKNALKEQPFYFSNYIDQATKESIIDSLYTTPLFNNAKINLADNNVDTALLGLINEAVQVKENATEDPAASLEKAKQLWNASKRPVLKNILLGIVNDNIFSNATADVAPTIDLKNAYLSVAANNQGFAFNNRSQLVSGNFEKCRLFLNENSFDNQMNRFFCGISDSVTSLKNISYLHYSDSNGIIALIDSFKIKFNNKGSIAAVDTIPRFVNVKMNDSRQLPVGLNNYLLVKLSPDGKEALLLDKDEHVLLKDISGRNGAGRIDTFGNYRNKQLGIDNIVFSPDGRYKLINGGGKLKVIGRNNKVIMTSVWDLEDIAAAAFTPDSKSVITVAEGELAVKDTMLNNYPHLQAINLNDPLLQSVIKPDYIQSVSISSNGKKLLIGQKNGKIFLVEKKNGDSLFIKNRPGEANSLRIKEIGNSRNEMKAAFYNDSTIITINDEGFVKTWPIFNDFENPDSAIAAVIPPVTFRDKLYNGSIGFRQVVASSSATDLNTAAYYYSNYNGNMDTAKMVYQELYNHSTSEMKKHYLAKMFELNKELINDDRINFSSAGNRRQSDAISAYRNLRVSRLNENVRLLKEMVSLCANNSSYKNELSTTYGSLSFNQLFVRQFKSALESSTLGLSFGIRKNDWINTNLALSNLVMGNYSAAEKIYTYYKDSTFADGRMTFKTAFLEDIAALEEAGIIDGLDETIRNYIDRIKAILTTATIPSKRIKMTKG